MPLNACNTIYPGICNTTISQLTPNDDASPKNISKLKSDRK